MTNNKKTFIELLKEQLEYGGVKYKNNDEKEVTDILTERYGLNGLLWCINKYVFRFKNLRRERDLLKIGAYMYILWLKFGYHLGQYNLQASINTTVETKLKYLNQFITSLCMYKSNRDYDISPKSTDTDEFTKFAITEMDNLIPVLGQARVSSPWILYEITTLTEELYDNGNYDGSDADTFNETGGKKSE